MKIHKQGAMAFAAFAFAVSAQPTKAAEVVVSQLLNKITISGDLRLRHEDFHKMTAGQVDRTRQRMRLRVNTAFDLPKNVSAKFTFASGTGEQVSTNQSADNLSSQKEFWIDKAFVAWTPKPIFTLQAGRMANPLWTQYSSDVVWDGDFNPEGASIGVQKLVGPVNFFVTGLAMIVDEDSGNNTTEGIATSTTTGVRVHGAKNRDQWMIGHQIGVEFKLPFETRLRAAYANYDWINERYGDFSQVANNEGNRRITTSTGSLINNFNVDEFTGVLSGWIRSIPVQVQGTYVKNKAARDFAGQNKEDTGFQVGTIIGKASAKNTFEVGYFRKHVRTDATVADIADSDFGDGGTNREGHIMWIAYAPDTWMLIQLKHFNTEVINVALSPSRDDIRRTQFDVSFKF